MANEVTIARSGMPFNELERLGEYIAKSSLFGIRTKEQAIVLMAIAQAEGRHPVEAARDYDIVNNRPAKKAEAMMRDFIQAGGKVEWHSLTDELADATFTHPQTGSVRIDWDMKRAKAAFGDKDMYKKFPRQMLRSRVVSEGVRTLWPLATSGLYVPEEVADMKAQPEHNGPTIEAEPSEREAVNEQVPLRAAAAEVQKPARKVDPRVYNAPKPALHRTDDQWRAWLTKLRDACAVLRYRSEVEDVAAKDTVGNALRDGPDFVRREISAILAESFARFADDEPAPEYELPEVEIAGEEKAGAG
jgi:hypothetical protein